MKPAIEISVVIPFFNEEESLEKLYAKVHDVLVDLGYSYELIFVDDGSNDGSNDIVMGLREKDDCVRLITFRRNRGKSAALSVGFKAAAGRYIVTMDADLQDDPEEIPNLVARLEEGYDLVSGWKKVRHDPLTKTIPSRFFNYVTGLLSGISLHDFNCGLKIYRSEVTRELTVYGERHRFLPVLVHMQGFKIGELTVKHHPRRFGRTKFGAYRFLAGFFDLITLLFRMKFLTKPLHLFGSLGMISLVAGLVMLVYLTILKFQGEYIGNRILVFLGVLGVGTGVQLITLGLLAEMIAGRAQQENPPLRDDSDLEPRQSQK